MILIIDNYDSFTYNLVQYIGEINPALEVHRNDHISAAEVLDKKPSHVVISPGPCTPAEAGISVELVRALPSEIPLLGVCLGHQSIGAAYGGKVIRAPYLMHGKTSEIRHDNSTLFAGIDSPFTATRYHSLIVERESLPSELQVTAWSEDGIIMAMQHKKRPVFGLQFHPESIMTECGKNIVKNFLQTQR